MASNLSPIILPVIGRILDVLRPKIAITRAINSDLTAQAATKGDTFGMPIYSDEGAAYDISPSAYLSSLTDTTVNNVDLVLDNWRGRAFSLKEDEAQKIANNSMFVPKSLEAAATVIAKDINTSILNTYHGVFGTVGAAGTTPFGSGVGVKSAVDAMIKLDEQESPDEPRSMVLGRAAQGQAVALSEFSDLEKSGDPNVKRDGVLGRKYGFDILAQNKVLTHTAGTLTGDPVVTGANAIGVKTIGLTCDADDVVALKKGDIVTFAGDTQTYAVGADLDIANSATGNLTITPGLKVATTGSEAISVIASHVVNLAFHRDAFAFMARYSRNPYSGGVTLQNEPIRFVDPVTGFPFAIYIFEGYHSITWEVGALWGVKLARAELACRVLG